MDKSYSIGDLMELYYERDIAQIEDIPLPTFSLKHKRKLKKAFRLFEKNKKKLGYGIGKENNSSIKRGRLRNMPLHKRIILAIIIIISLAFITSCVIAFVSKSFRGNVYSSNTYIFSYSTEEFPTSIEKMYKLSFIPEGFKEYEIKGDDHHIITVYRNESDKNLFFEQIVKDKFNSHINTEGYTLQELFINDYNAICAEYKTDTAKDTLLIWNSKDYILKLCGNFTKDELINLANSNEKAEF